MVGFSERVMEYTDGLDQAELEGRKLTYLIGVVTY